MTKIKAPRKKKPETMRTSFYIQTNLHTAMQYVMQETGISLTRQINDALKLYLKRNHLDLFKKK